MSKKATNWLLSASVALIVCFGISILASAANLSRRPASLSSSRQPLPYAIFSFHSCMFICKLTPILSANTNALLWILIDSCYALHAESGSRWKHRTTFSTLPADRFGQSDRVFLFYLLPDRIACAIRDSIHISSRW